MYLSALPICLLPTYLKNKDNYNYRSLGASGAVSAVVFAFIFLDPLRKLGLIFLPPNFMIPGFIFGLLYLAATSYLDKKGGGNINHSAHLWGSLYGVAFIIIFGFVFSDQQLVTEFLSKIQYYLKSL
jgi:membrane associated rhomboid family serine protease